MAAVDKRTPSLKLPIDSYLSKAKEVVSSFQTSQGAPAYYVTMPYAELPDARVKLDTYVFLNRLLGRLVEVDSVLASYAAVERNDPEFWAEHFKSTSSVVETHRKTLVQMLDVCVDQGDCNKPLPPKYALVLPDDVFNNGRLSVVCGNDIRGTDGGSDVLALSDYVVVWRGFIAYPNFLQLNAVQAFAVDGAGNKTLLSAFRADRDFSVDPVVLRTPTRPNARGPGRAIAQLVNQKLPIEEVLEGDKVNGPYLASFLKEKSQTFYGLTVSTKTGTEYDIILGKPDVSQCRMTQPGVA
jgi:hypothetical protein